MREALDHLPSLLVLDDLDMLCPAEAAGADGGATSADPALVAWLCDLLDHLAAPSPDWGRLPLAGQPTASGGPSPASAMQLGAALWPPLAVAATCKDAAALAAPLRAAGRLDHVVSLPPPTAESRAAILAAAAAGRGVQLDGQHVRLVAEEADGFDAADLEVLLDRALHIAVRRQLADGGNSSDGDRRQLLATTGGGGGGTSTGGLAAAAASAQPARLHVTREDMEAALQGFTPAAFWGTGTRMAVQAGVQGWADVGGMEDARQALHEALELPTRYAHLVAQAPLRLRTGVLLYGPPGCGKTHIVAAAVAAANVRCITVRCAAAAGQACVGEHTGGSPGRAPLACPSPTLLTSLIQPRSGPELLNKYIGASEAAVRDVFRRASAAAPSVLFFDEFDAIAPQVGGGCCHSSGPWAEGAGLPTAPCRPAHPASCVAAPPVPALLQRGHDNTGVTDRVVNQLLTELDGVEGLRGAGEKSWGFGGCWVCATRFDWCRPVPAIGTLLSAAEPPPTPPHPTPPLQACVWSPPPPALT